MTDHYATWNPESATDKCDGLPDIGMVLLVETLKTAGFTTYQSCYGHEGEGDGCLWIKEGPPRNWWFPHPFTRIQHVYHGPEGDYWEWQWYPESANAAVLTLTRCYGVEVSR